MAYMNLYQSGYFHRRGKPSQFNCHPGDLYLTAEAAMEDVDPDVKHLYIGTYRVEVPEYVLGKCNDADAVPTPLSVTRRIMRNPLFSESELAMAEYIANRGNFPAPLVNTVCPTEEEVHHVSAR